MLTEHQFILDTVHQDPETKQSYKIVWEEKIQGGKDVERRVAVEEMVVDESKGTAKYRVITATCSLDCAAPKWAPRTNWKDTYEAALERAQAVYSWNCDYAHEHGYKTPCEIIAGK